MLQVKLEKPTPDNSTLIPLTQGKIAIVDKPVPDGLFAHRWIAVIWHYRWYAYSYRLRDGSPCRVSMHRLIADTPIGEVCHHLNRNSLDNRLANLLNLTNFLHAQLHGIRKWGRKNQ